MAVPSARTCWPTGTPVPVMIMPGTSKVVTAVTTSTLGAKALIVAVTDADVEVMAEPPGRKVPAVVTPVGQ